MKTLRAPFILIALLAITALTGCVPQVSKEQMVVPAIVGASKHSGTVLLSVSGADKNLWASPQNFQDAIADSLIQSGLFSKVVTTGDADYHLEVLMVKMDQSNGIFIWNGTTGSARIMWTLTRVNDHKQVFQNEFATDVTSHEFAGVTRVKAAMSGCIKKNIQEAIEQITKTEY